jgi:potassium-dependent mechanosensitive channel
MIDPRVQALLEQMETILLLLERPVVQRQLAAFILIFLVSWLLPEPLGVLLNRLLTRQDAIRRELQEQGLEGPVWQTRFLRWARGAQMLLFPVVGLVVSQLTIGYFGREGWQMGLLERLAQVFWLVLAYRLIASLLLAFLAPETATSYQKRFVLPIVVILVGFVLGTGLAGTFPIFSIELFTVLETSITLQTLAVAAVVLYIFLALSWVTKDVLTHVVLPSTQADAGVAGTVLVISRYTIVGLGIMASLSTLGFNLSALAIIFGGLSVGIGFGLQELVANFISGLLLLFERSLRPGDVIEVGGQRGTVSQLRMRSTVLRTIDNIEIFVPNKTLLTSMVATYTHTDRTIRRVIRVGVSYRSDPTEVRDVLLGVVESHGLVLKEPKPTVFFVGFGDSSLDFEIGVWIGEPARTLQILHDLHMMIFKEFARHNIEIPYPQRDLHVRSADGLGLERFVDRVNALQATNGDQRTEDVAGKHAEDQGETPAIERVSAPAEKPKLPG